MPTRAPAIVAVVQPAYRAYPIAANGCGPAPLSMRAYGALAGVEIARDDQPHHRYTFDAGISAATDFLAEYIGIYFAITPTQICTRETRLQLAQKYILTIDNCRACVQQQRTARA